MILMELTRMDGYTTTIEFISDTFLLLSIRLIARQDEFAIPISSCRSGKLRMIGTGTIANVPTNVLPQAAQPRLISAIFKS